MTTDFAMQNVALQMGLLLLSHSGKQVASVKSWVLKCDACFSIFPMHGLRQEDSLFCRRCGNATLARLGVTLGSDGAPRYHYKRFRQINVRGTVYALPAPAGGRMNGSGSGAGSSGQLLLRPDQLLSGGWKEKLRKAGKAERDALLAERLGSDGQDGQASSGSSWGGGAWAQPQRAAAMPLPPSIEVGAGRKNPNSNGRRRK